MNITIIFTALFSGLVNIVFTFFFAVCLAYAAWYFINYRKLNADLLLAIEILEKYRNAGDEEDEDGSAQGSLKYEELNTEMKTTAVQGVWEAFEKTIVKSGDSQAGYEAFLTQNPREYFSASELKKSLEEKRFVSLTIVRNMSGIFTGLGILGTFIGLTMGLGNLNLSTIEHMQAGIAALLQGTVTAFNTSVWGLILALTFNFVNGWFDRDLNACSAAIVSSIIVMFREKSVEEILMEQKNVMVEQASQLRNLNEFFAVNFEDMLFKLGDRIEQSLPISMADVMDDKMSPLFANLDRSIGKLASCAGDTLSEAISQSAGAEIEKLTKTLSEAQDKLQNSLSGIEKVMEEAGIAADKFKVSSEPVEQATMSLKTQAEQLEDVTNKFSDTISSQVETWTNLSIQNNQDIKNVLESLQTMRELWGSYEQNFKDVSGELDSTFETLNKGIEKYNQTVESSLSNSLKQFDGSIAQAFGQIHGLLQDTNATIEKLQQSVEAVTRGKGIQKQLRKKDYAEE